MTLITKPYTPCIDWLRTILISFFFSLKINYFYRSFSIKMIWKIMLQRQKWNLPIRFNLKQKRHIPFGCSDKGKENWTQGGGDKVSVHFVVTFLDCWRTSFCVTTIIKIVNNNTNDKQTFGASLALDEDSPYTNSCLFTLDRLPLLLLLRKN